MIRTGFNRVFWGTLIVAIDVSLNDFDVLVDLVGWCIVVAGLGRLRGLRSGFATARGWALLATALSIFDLGLIDTVEVVRTSGNVTITMDKLWPVRVVQFVVTIMVGWTICRSCAVRADAQGLSELARVARSRGMWIVGVSVVGALVTWGAWLVPDAAMLAFPLIPVALVVGLLFLLLLRRAGRELHLDPPDVPGVTGFAAALPDAPD